MLKVLNFKIKIYSKFEIEVLERSVQANSRTPIIDSNIEHKLISKELYDHTSVLITYTLFHRVLHTERRFKPRKWLQWHTKSKLQLVFQYGPTHFTKVQDVHNQQNSTTSQVSCSNTIKTPK